MRKKATFTLTHAAILAVLALIILLFITKNIMDAAERTAHNTACKQSVLQYSMFAKQGFPTLPKIKCPTKYKTFSGSDEAMKAKLVEEMYYCYDNFGQGDVEIFKRSRGIFAKESNPKSNNFCVICTVVEFQDKNKKINGFSQYLQKQEIPNGDITYAQFFTKTETVPGITDRMQTTPVDSIDTSKKYAVMFMYAQDSYWSGFDRMIVGGGAGAVGGLIIVQFIPGVNVASWVGMGIVGIMGATGMVTGATVGPPQAQDWGAAAMLWPYSLEQMQKLNCNEIPVEQHVSK